MAKKVTPFLMFAGTAEEAMNFYVSVFEDAEIKNITRYGKGEAGKEGSVEQAMFRVNGQEFMCIDSPSKHDFTFTPSISFYVVCKNDVEIEDIFLKLSLDGSIMMPLDNYGFSEKFGWVSDRFGVSWQLDLPYS
jgi:predicted 3-demethylubiquinone-9 3-methyltransferase (glyoxalase superfamily)